MRGETLANFYIAVTEGREDMPAYKDDLSSDERWDVVYYVWRLSTGAETLKTGKGLYDRDCASCHGEDGSGALLGSADFTDLRQMDQLAPRDLYLTLTQGRGSMPGWQSLLSQADRWAIIDYLLTFTYDPSLPHEVALTTDTETPTPGEEPATAQCSTDQTNPYDWDDPQAIQAGQSIYLLQCALCHGPDGSGGLPNTPDFTSEEVNLDLKAQPGRYLCSLVEGVGSMPAFGVSLSDEEQWQLLTYMGSLGP
jgi:mono/diheme cytochrome c family protein